MAETIAATVPDRPRRHPRGAAVVDSSVIRCAQCGQQNPDGARFCNSCAAPLTADVPVRGEVRKVVTVVFCDVTGSTELGERLDPEALRAVLAEYFEEMRQIVERHGGTVEKFIGDAVMAVFGVPAVHEDDALRAVRAAVDMRDALPGLGVRGRLGVMTGEVVSGTLERLATGDAVNVAARLEQAAQPGQVLIGAPTLALVHDAVDVEPVEPLALKGKAEPVPAYRLVAVRDAPERRHGGPFVGRERELALIGEAWERVRLERRCELVSVVGDAGVGKSRLVAEALGGVAATVVRGRCLPYGEGITYWPVVEVLKQLDVAPVEESAAAAIGSLLGDTEAPTSVEEIAWGFRKTLEQAAIARPLVVVFDDIHWGEQAFLDLIEHVALLSSGASILLVCIARLELTERRATWPVLLRLEPLSEDDVDELIADRIPVELRERIGRAAGGNPLFVEEMLAMAGGAGGDVVGSTDAACAVGGAAGSARLGRTTRARVRCDRGRDIPPRRRADAGTGARAGDAAPGRAGAQGIDHARPALLEGEDGFRFRHLLILDAAYDALSKASRADLHQRFAAWLETHGQELVELDELLGYHLEQAGRYRIELGLPRDEPLVSAARGRLISAGRRAYLRADYGAAAPLLERAATLISPGDLELSLEIQLIDALFQAGRVSGRCSTRGVGRRARLSSRRPGGRALREDPDRHHQRVPRTGGRGRTSGRTGRPIAAGVPGRG